MIKINADLVGYQYDASWKQEPQLSWVSRGRSTDEAFCQYCQCYINIRWDGMEALLTHTDLESHQFIMNYKRGLLNYSTCIGYSCNVIALFFCVSTLVLYHGGKCRQSKVLPFPRWSDSKQGQLSQHPGEN